MKQYSTFLFDFDGTLLDSNEHVISCFQKAFQHVLGKDLPRETITATFGIPLAQALQDLAPEHADELLRVYRQYSDEAGFSMLYEIDGAYDTIRALHDMGCTIAIVTSKKEVNATAQMDYIGIGDYCALEHLGVNAEDALMVGDSPHDILCGKNAHVDTAGVRFTAVDLDSLLATSPTYMLSHLSELLPLAKAQ